MQIHPNLVPYIQHITNVVIQASQNNRNNAARVYIANCVATNPQFVNEIVGTVCDFITLNIGKGVIPGYSWGNLEQTINDAVARVLTMFTSNAIQRNENGLAAQVDPVVMREAIQHVQNFAAFISEVNAMRMAAGVPYQQMGGQPNMGMQQPMPQNQYGMIPQQGYPQAGYPQQQRFQPAARTFQPVTTNDNYFGAQRQAVVGQQSQPSASGRTYAPPQAVQQQVMQPNIEQPPVVEETPADPTEWFTSVLQPYQPVFRKSQDSYKLEWKQAGKEKIPFITIINGVPMDRRQHETAFQGIRRHDSDVNMFDGAEVTIARTSEPVVTAEDEAIESIASTFSSTTDSQWYQNSTLQDAVLNTNLIFECDGSQKSVMTMNLITTPVVTDKNYYELLSDLAESQTIRRLITKIKRLLAVQMESNSPIEKLMHRLDKKLTEEFNKLIKTRLCIDTLSASSFVDDCEDIVNYLRDKYGQTYASALEKIENEFIESSFCVISTVEDHDQYIDTAAKMALPEKGVTITFLSQYCTITRVNVNSETLDVGFVNDKVSGFINGSKHRELLALCVNIFERIKDKFSDASIAHHYLVTSDDKIYELHESAITGNDYLISFVGDNI